MPTEQVKGKRTFVTVAISKALADALHAWRATQVVTPSFSATVEAMTRLGLSSTIERTAAGAHNLMIPGPDDIEPAKPLCRQCRSEADGKPERGMCTCPVGRKSRAARKAP